MGSPSDGSLAVTAKTRLLLSVTVLLPTAARTGGWLLAQHRGSEAVIASFQPEPMLPESPAAWSAT
jgi:hypothetical protein